jgi:NAD(P)-dependent dehydrogenase (short-subunit alcohol dehydrogenase family)
MSRVLITGSSDGLGLMAARLLADDGHQVTLHARNDARAAETRRAVPGAEAVVVGDLASIAEMRRIAEQVNALGTYDAVIHNAGVGYREPRVETIDGLEHIFAVNVLAPYLLTALIEPPGRLVYLSSGMHTGGDASLADPRARGTVPKRMPTVNYSMWPVKPIPSVSEVRRPQINSSVPLAGSQLKR